MALCDVDSKYSAPVFEKYPNARKWTDFRKMLDEQKDIDAVVVATPDHLHAVVAMAAMQRGKHVYVQKPLTRTVWEARMLTEAARKYKVQTQMGNQGHSSEEVRLVSEWIQDGAIGDVREVHCWTNRPVWPQGIDRPKDTPPVPEGLDWDLWIGPSPMRPYNPIYLPFNWRAWIDFGAGALGDMGCHVMDAAFSALKLKYPVSVQASHSWEVKEMWTRFDNKETYPSAEVVHYQFPARGNMPPVKLHWYDGGILPERPEDLEAGTEHPGKRHDLRRRQGQAHLRHVQRESPHLPREQDEGLQEAWRRLCAESRAAWTVTSRTGSMRARADRPPARISTTPARSPRRSSWATWPF